MMRFLKHKATYFGIGKVASEITLADLNEDDKQVLRTGPYHIQEERDQTGRMVLHMVNTRIDGLGKVENVVSVSFKVCFHG